MDMEEELFKGENEYAAQAGTGVLLNPRIDSTFKAMFTQKTKESRDALRFFLSAAIERKVRGCKVSANDAPIQFLGQRGVSYDIACEFEDGTAAEVEMQAFKQKYDYGKRSEYQVARLEATYYKKGAPWEEVPTVYQISILDFLWQSNDRKGGKGFVGGKEEMRAPAVSRYAMRTKDGRELSNSLNIIFVELPKVEGLEASLESNTSLENWAIFLKDADNPRKKDIIQKLVSKEAGLMQAQKSLSSISNNRDLWIAQFRQDIYEGDRISNIYAANKEGWEKGWSEGLEQGRSEGVKEKSLALARKYMALGHSAKEAAEFAEIDESLLR